MLEAHGGEFAFKWRNTIALRMYKFQLEEFLFDVNAQTALPYLLLHAPVEQLLWEHRGAQQQIWFAAYNVVINCAA
jgi:hypothetical protein